MNANACGKTLFLFLGAVLLFGMVGCTTAGGGGAGDENVNENDNVTTNGNVNDNTPPYELPCGDGECDAAGGEDCSTCADDCGECPTPCQDEADCDDDNACTEDVCNEEGECEHTAIEECCTADADCAEGKECDESSHECVVGPAEVVASPTFTPSDGPFTDFVDVTLSCATPGASIRYTTDGSAPTASQGTAYTAAIHLTATTTLKAIAYAAGVTESSVQSATYTKAPPRVEAPTFSPNGGTFPDSVDVTISCTTTGASIRYTTDGSAPTASQGTPYAAPIHLTATTTVRAVAYKTGMTDSDVTSATFTKQALSQVATPTYSPPGGTFADSIDVTISCATAGASIRYTTDGSTPSASQGTVYASPIHLTATTTLQAVAYVASTISTVASATYTRTQWAPLGNGMLKPGGVAALAIYNNASTDFLIAAGWFDHAGGTPFNRIASWKDGTGWTELGSGMDDEVHALLTPYKGDLIAGGSFTTAGGTAANRIASAHWDSTLKTWTWTPLGTGMNGTVDALAVYGTDLIAGGSFTTAGGTAANRIARWTGTSWVPLGTGINGRVYALTVYKVNGKDELIAGGEFTMAGGTAVSGIARWNGTTSTWAALGDGVNGRVYALAVYKIDSKDELIVGGWFSKAGGTNASHIARWNGTGTPETWKWNSLGSGMNGSVDALKVYGTDLIAGGEFTTAGGVSANRIARWKGTTKTWTPLGSGMEQSSGAVRGLAVYGVDLIAGCGSTAVDGTSAYYISRWNGTSWAPLGDGMDNTVSALTVNDPAGKNELIAGGDFTAVGGVAANRIALWDVVSGENKPLGTGMNNTVNALTTYDGRIHAGGSFTIAGGTPANSIAWWKDPGWEQPGTEGVAGPVYALLTVSNGLIVGGLFTFTTAGGEVVNNIVRWNGAWTPLGDGVNGDVYALALYKGDLIAAGWFTTAGTTAANSIARWNGTSWAPLGSGMNNRVDALTVYKEELIAGGEFTSAGGVPCNRIARWNGTSWAFLGSGMNGPVLALTVYKDELIAGGEFTTAGGASANRIARWNGTSWAPLGTGMNAQVYALTVYNNELIAAGEFTKAGGMAANRIARWRPD